MSTIDRTAASVTLLLVDDEAGRNSSAATWVFANLMEMREGEAAAMDLGEEAVQNGYFAGLLHDIGEISVPVPGAEALCRAQSATAVPKMLATPRPVRRRSWRWSRCKGRRF